MLSLTRRRFARPPLRAILIAVLAFALSIALLDTTAPAHKAAAPRISVSSVCNDTINAAETAYHAQAPSVATGPVVQNASLLTTTQAAALSAKQQAAVANCTSRLNAQQAGWSYLSARGVEIAVDVSITFLASTLICAFTGPVGCKWGVRFAAFTGGFFGALAFQYLTDGTLNWNSVGGAFFDATVSMLSFSGLDALQERYIAKGVKATFQSAGGAIKAVGARIGSAGPAMVSSVQNAAEYIITHTSAWAFPTIAYTGGGSVEPVIAERQGQPIADGLQLRTPGAVSGWTTTPQDLHSGPDLNHQYPNWDIQESRFTNGEGAVGYVIGQGNSCLTWETDYGQVGFQPCDLNAYNQIWYVDGNELMARNNECMNEDWNGSKRWLSGCDGLTTPADPNRNDDMFVLTPPGGSVIPDNIFHWKNDVSIYEHA